jgi:BirA family biotin operon repressor/biotin-[acetyl-CoA-carboxylase] ligase
MSSPVLLDADAPLPLLDAAGIEAALPPGLRPLLHSIRIDSQVESTQLPALAACPAPGQSEVFVAEQQTAGQGRLGRAWISPARCNLYASVAHRFDLPPARLAGLSLVTGIALAEALRAAGASRVGVKWPNDLVVDGRKLGGVLVQLRALPGDATLAAIGFGINVRMPAVFDARIGQPWCDLAQSLGELPSRNSLLAGILGELLPALAMFSEQGLAPFLERWHALDSLRGSPAKVINGDSHTEGECLGIAESGALRLRVGDQVREFHGGEVSVRGA